jgi:hypothetical protein
MGRKTTVGDGELMRRMSQFHGYVGPRAKRKAGMSIQDELIHEEELA